MNRQTNIESPLGRPRFRVAVRDLVAATLAEGDLTHARRPAPSTYDAIAAHRRIQQSWPPWCQAEVPVSRTVETDRLILTVGGRLDGLGVSGQGVVVEEIKTTLQPLSALGDGPDAGENPHWAQARVYAFMVAEGRGLSRIDAALTYCHLPSHETRRFRRHFLFEDLRAWHDALIQRYLQWLLAVADWRERRNAAIASASFPFSGYRPGQREMADAVACAIRGEGTLLLAAPTGIGKTAGVLYPAVRALGEGGIDRIVYATARNTGKVAGGVRIKSLAMAAREQLCFAPDADCSPESCPWAAGFYERLGPAMADGFAAMDAFAPGAIRKVARRHRICPHAFALALAPWVDCIICDYNHVFDPRARMRHPLEDGTPAALLVDEAHQLADRAREMFSAALSVADFQALLARQPLTGGPMADALSAVIDFMTAPSMMAAGGAGPEEAFSDFQVVLRAFVDAVRDHLSDGAAPPGSPGRDLLECGFEAIHFLRLLERRNAASSEPAIAGGMERNAQGDVRARLFCVDPSGEISAALGSFRAAVFFSATLEPFEYFQTLFGLGPETDRLASPSPFPPEHFGVFVADRIDVTHRRRRESAPDVAAMLLALALSRTGNYLAFFPSHEYLEMVRERFAGLCSHVRVVAQRPRMNEAEREAFLSHFVEGGSESVLGFAVMGGIFGEGIDLAGERLSGVAVIGAGWPAVTPERERIRAFFDETLDDGLAYAYACPGIHRVLQAAGRVIRSETDRGVALLVDRRFGRDRYQRHFPRGWRPERVSGARSLAAALARFWREAIYPEER